MKISTKILLICTIMAVLCNKGYGQSNTFTITSNIKNWDANKDSTFVIVYNSMSDYYWKYIPLKNGQIHYTDTISKSAIYNIGGFGKKTMKLVSENAGIPSQAGSAWIIVQPGANIHLEGNITDFCDVYPSGNFENENMARITQKIMPLLNDAANTQLKISLLKNGSDNKEETSVLEEELNKISNEVSHNLKTVLKENPNNLATLFFTLDGLNRNRIDLITAKTIFNDTKRTKLNAPFYDDLENNIKASNFDIGNKIFEINDATANGEKFSTKDLLGKFYIIDFWGTWCGPCMDGMPKLKELKDKYAGKLEILGINKGDDLVTLKSHLANDKTMSWIHIQNGHNDKNYVAKLNVTGYPTKILIGPDGTILYRITGEHNNFQEEIEKFLK